MIDKLYPEILLLISDFLNIKDLDIMIKTNSYFRKLFIKKFYNLLCPGCHYDSCSQLDHSFDEYCLY